MKLASLKADSRDGSLIVVDRALERAVSAAALAPSLRAALDDPVHGAHPLAAADDLEASPLLRFGDDEVLQHAARLDIEGQSLLEFGIGPLADIVFALVELAQRNELHLLDS